MNHGTKQKAIFLDRDGTVNKEKEFLWKPQDFQFIPGAEKAIKIFNNLGYTVLVITNQSGVARGFYAEEDVMKLHCHINGLLRKRCAIIDAFYFCPHHVDGVIEKYAIDCDCRKPKTGMILKAEKDFNLDLDRSIIIGDKEIDVLAGKNAGIGEKILIRSGHPVDEKNTVADAVFGGLYDYALFFKNRAEQISPDRSGSRL